MHGRQHYELVNWRVADDGLNYRRFFAVNSLAAVRVEDPEVFADSHVEIRRWFTEGLVDGLRVDHPDGLRDPRRYLDDLAELTGHAYVLVEKILEPGEELPGSWATAGTTGYDALAHIDRVLTDPAGQGPLDALETRLRGVPVDWHAMIHDTKREVADGILHSEVNRITREVLRHPGRSRARRPRLEPRLEPRRSARGGGRRRRRAAGLLPRLPVLPARGSRAPRPGGRAGAGAPPGPARDARRAACRCWPTRTPGRRGASSRPAAW